MPEIVFKLDTSIETGLRIGTIREMENEKAGEGGVEEEVVVRGEIDE